MKVALLLPGYLRTFAETATSLRQHVIEPTHCDTFIVTYSKLGFNRNDGPLANHDTYHHMDSITKLLNPVKMMIIPTQESIRVGRYTARRNQIKWAIDRNRWLGKTSGHQETINTVILMFKNVWRCNNLLKEHERATGIKYDVVIRARSDMEYRNSINLEHLASCQDSLYLPSFIHAGGANDQFAFSSSALMDVYADCYKYVEKYFFSNRVSIHAEIMLGHHLKVCDVPLKHTDIQYVLCRGNGKVTDQTGLP